MAEAVQELYPGTQVTIGPVIENGFYYDFARDEPFTPEDLPVIEAKMREIIARDSPFTCEVIDRDAAKRLFADKGETFKLELIDAIPEGDEIKIYSQREWLDLCRGPHMTSTGKVGKGFKLLKIAGAYWRGDSTRPMLQRIYGTAWASEEELAAYLHQLEEAEKRDHRRLGREMDLFHFQEEAPGAVFWHPKGWALFQALIGYMRRRQQAWGYVEVNSPDMLDRALWEQSGHWEKFAENMYITETPDERVYCCKPMNCPGHVQIFKHGLKSYRDLPLRIAEFGKVHRYEPSGALHGLLRVRHFTQDDAHIFCTEDQITEECVKLNEQMLSIYRDFGFEDVRIKFSDRPDKRVGSDEVWDKAEAALKRAVVAAGLQYELSPGEGRVLRTEARICAARRHRPRLAMRHDPGRSQHADAARRLLYRAGRREDRTGDDPPRHVRVARAFHRHPDRASRRPSAAVALSGAGHGRADRVRRRRLCHQGA